MGKVAAKHRRVLRPRERAEEEDGEKSQGQFSLMGLVSGSFSIDSSHEVNELSLTAINSVCDMIGMNCLSPVTGRPSGSNRRVHLLFLTWLLHLPIPFANLWDH
jgi:hypothetical protein